jgi:hypothetical protein
MSEFLRNDLQSSTQETVRALLDFLRAQNLAQEPLPNAPPEQRQAYEHLTNLLGQQRPQELNEIDQFEFIIPNQSLQTFLATLGNIRPQLNLHYTDRHHVLHANVNPASFAYQDVELAGLTARDALRENQPEANEGQLLAAQTNAERNARTANAAARAANPQWELLQREHAGDVRLEDSLLVFTDPNHKNPDWNHVIRNLKTYGESLGYTNAHYKRVMDRFVGYFAPALKSVTDDLPALELARFLMRMSIPTPKFEKIASQIENLTRPPNDNLRNVLAQLQGLAQAYYATKPEAERPQLINRLMIKGLYSFTSGITQSELKSALDRSQAQGRVPMWTSLLDACVNSERQNGTPQTLLKFQQINNSSTSLFLSTFESVESPVYFTPTPVEYPLNPALAHNPYNDNPNHFDIASPLYPHQHPRTVQIPRPPNPRPILLPPAAQNLPLIRPPNIPPLRAPINPVPRPPIQQLIPENREINQIQDNLDNLQIQQYHNQYDYFEDAVEHLLPEKPIDQLQDLQTPPPTPAKQENTIQPPAVRSRRELHLNQPPPPRRSNRDKTQFQPFDAYLGQHNTNILTPTDLAIMATTAYNQGRAASQYMSENKQNNTSTSYKNNPSSSANKPYLNRHPSPSHYNNTPIRNSSSSYRYQSRSPTPTPPYQNNYRTDNRISPTRYQHSSVTNRSPSNSRENRQYNLYRSNNLRPASPSFQPTNGWKPSIQNNTRSNSRTNSRSPSRSYYSSSQQYQNQRPRSTSPRNYPGFMPGTNCAPDYKPYLMKHCFKCNSRSDHHEYQCPKYLRFNPIPCPKCKNGHHFPNECDRHRSQSTSPIRQKN